MQVNGFSNTFMGLGGFSARPNEDLQQPNQVASSTAPISTQGDSGRRVVASNSAESPLSSTETDQDRQEREAEQQVIRELAARDREVRQHEMAHQVAGGQYTGAVTYTFERGPDGMMYAVGGEVSIDTSPVPGDPEATLEKAQVVERAALAPVDPSPQDLRVAASARAMANEARAEILQEQQEERESGADEMDPFAEQNRLQEQRQLEEQELQSTEDVEEAERLAAERQAELDEAEEESQARREAIAEEQQLRRERAAEAMREFAQDLAEIQAQLRELNKRLVETGALQASTSVGTLLDQQA